MFLKKEPFSWLMNKVKVAQLQKQQDVGWFLRLTCGI